MPTSPRKLGILLAATPASANFKHAIRLAATAQANGVLVFLYCLDDAVAGLIDPTLQTLAPRGVRLFACAEAARRRGLPHEPHATYSGLATLHDIMSATDRFVAFT